MDTAKVDARGRISIPAEIREKLGIEPGDVYIIEEDRDRSILRLAKAENPLDGLAHHAVEEYQAGHTRSLRDYAAEQGIDVDDE